MYLQRTRIFAVIITALSALLLSPARSQASTINFTLTQSSQSGAPGDTLVFDGTLSNPGTTPVSLAGDNLTTQATFLVGNDSAFINNTPVSLAPSGSPGDSVGPVELFDVTILGNATPGVYSTNFFNVIGGANNGLLATAQFTVTVTSAAVPEPGVLLMLGTGIAAVVLIFRRRRKLDYAL
jgi:hypothetical protein